MPSTDWRGTEERLQAMEQTFDKYKSPFGRAWVWDRSKGLARYMPRMFPEPGYPLIKRVLLTSIGVAIGLTIASLIGLYP